MKLEFQKCLPMMDNCLVLPRAQAWSRLQAYLSGWRKAILLKREHNQMGRKLTGADCLIVLQRPLLVKSLMSLGREQKVLVEMLHESPPARGSGGQASGAHGCFAVSES
ncbi:hypothetical protein EOD39_6567 [Acipenser ruthenus]|uniref:Uncharacterized protein n=1 Tax=Acipenser ruthenus TaxID=7906 RepID=A0A444U9Q2_ACIRT|nr:hypothetical protein EOD39_6567 [Acipenser ruthenus]